jgi:hypothetical protein
MAFIHTGSRMFDGKMPLMASLPATAAHQLQGAGAGDAGDPSERGGVGIAGMHAEAASIAADVEKRLLGRIFGQGMLAADAESRLVDRFAMSFDEHRPGLRIRSLGKALEDG